MDFLRSHAESQPDKPAVVCGEQVLDFATLNRRASRAANVFTGLGCVEGDRVAWMSFNSIAGAEIANGLRRAGLVIVPVNYRLRGAEIAYVLNDSQAKVAAAGPDHVEAMAAAVPEVKSDVRFIAAAQHVPRGWLSYRELMETASEEFETVGDGLGPSMIYTSGTTGHPKGAWRPNGVDIANVLQVISIFGLNQDDVHLMCGPGYHSAVSFFSALHGVLGATVVMQPRFDAEGALDLIARHLVAARDHPRRRAMPARAQDPRRGRFRAGTVGVLRRHRDRHQHGAAARGPAAQARIVRHRRARTGDPPHRRGRH